MSVGHRTEMLSGTVAEILLPYRKGLPETPSVSINDKIAHAIELMVTHDLACIAVVRNRRPVGMIRLEDAFKRIGLQGTKGT
ncbi:MAG: CBS domain-containing protein [Deltaproteobacteria bacterium]|nr:CBS domain-containing protein [Deltaproteobacteria bacterium]